MQNAPQGSIDNNIIDAEITTPSPELTDEEVNRYFDSGGEVQEAPPEEEPVAEVVQAVDPKEESYKDALHLERTKRQTEARQNQEMQQKIQLMEQRFQQFMERQYNPPAPVPKFDEDPLGALAHQQEQLRQAVQYQQAVEQQRMQEMEHQQAVQRFMQQYTGDAQRFTQEAPDYLEAYKFLVSNRFEELKTMGYNDWQAKQLIQQDEMALAAKAYEDQVNPAERLYAAAKMRGYLKTAQQAPEQKLKAIAKAKEAAVSLSNSSSANSKQNGLTLEAIASMDIEEFDAITPNQWKKLWGG